MFGIREKVGNWSMVQFRGVDNGADDCTYQPMKHEMNDRSVDSAGILRRMRKRISIGSDHAGFELKRLLIEHLEKNGHDVADVGAFSNESIDYPTPAHAVALSVKGGDAEFGILLCGSGNGVNIAANRHPGVRSALAWNPEIAALARQHNDANIVAVPARFVSEQVARDIVDAFIDSVFEGGRHKRRIEKIEEG